MCTLMQTAVSWADCNRCMLENEATSDVEFTVGAQSIKAHKYVLAARSPVFMAMFFGDLATTSEELPILVSDQTYEAFKHMLRYIYCGDCALTGENVLQVLYASKKYLLPDLTKLCTKFLEDNLNTENVCMLYDQLLTYNEVTSGCTRLIETRTPDVLQSSGFTNLSYCALEKIVQFPRLSSSEQMLFHSCLAWSLKVCQRKGLNPTPANQRLVLGNILSHIRFPTMSLQEFVSDVRSTGVLSREDDLAVIEYIACRRFLREGSESDHLPTPLRFPVTPRLEPSQAVLRRFRWFGKGFTSSGTVCSMSMRCSRAVKISGFGVGGTLGCDSIVKFFVTIKQKNKCIFNRVLVNMSDEIKGEVVPVVMGVLDATLLQPYTWYKIMITLYFRGGSCSDNSCRIGKGGSKSISCDGVHFEFDSPEAGDLIHEVMFSKAD